MSRRHHHPHHGHVFRIGTRWVTTCPCGWGSSTRGDWHHALVAALAHVSTTP